MFIGGFIISCDKNIFVWVLLLLINRRDFKIELIIGILFIKLKISIFIELIIND